MVNEKIRLHAKKMDIPLWKVADKMGFSEATLSRRLRHELPDSEANAYIVAIDELFQEKLDETLDRV